MSRPEFARVLTIAGSDPSGGAGLQADLRTISLLGGYGMAIPTAITVQNSLGVAAVHALPAVWLQAQWRSIVADTPPHAIKLGMLGEASVLSMVFECLAELQSIGPVPVVCDPVLVSSSGKTLLAEDALHTLLAKLPQIDLLTPNVPEAMVLTGLQIHTPAQVEQAAQALLAQGARAVLVKGGHLDGHLVGDCFLSASQPDTPAWWYSPRVITRNDHGTGCTLSAAIATKLATGASLQAACADAKAYLSAALSESQGVWNGEGRGGFMRYPLP